MWITNLHISSQQAIKVTIDTNVYCLIYSYSPLDSVSNKDKVLPTICVKIDLLEVFKEIADCLLPHLKLILLDT